MKIRFGEFIMDTGRGTVTGANGVIELRRQTFRVLEVLLRHAPDLVDRDTVLDQAWGHDALSPNILAQVISELRLALGDDARAPRYIATVHRRGYRLVCPVERLEERSGNRPAALPASNNPAGKRIGLPTLALIMIAIASVVVLASRWPIAGKANETAPLYLALGEFAATGNLPDWLAAATPTLIQRTLDSDQFLVLLPLDALGPAEVDQPEQQLRRAAELLGADQLLTGQWAKPDPDHLRLTLTVHDTRSGNLIWQLDQAGPAAAPDRLLISGLEGLSRELVPERPPVTTYWTELAGELRQVYMQALGDFRLSRSERAARSLAGIFHRAGQPAWIAPELARMLVAADRRAAAVDVLETAAAQPGLMPALEHRLANRAELARIHHDNDDLIVNLRALTSAREHDAALLIELITLEMDNTTGNMIGRLIERLESLLPNQVDPRLLLLRARQSRSEGRLDESEFLVAEVARLADAHQLPMLGAAAELARVLTVRARGGNEDAVAQAHQWPQQAFALNELVALAAPSGSHRFHESAFATGSRSLPVYRQLQMDAEAARNNFIQGLVARNQGRFDDSVHLLDEAVSLYRSAGNPDQTVRSSAFRADVLVTAGRYSEAADELESTHELLREATATNRARWWMIRGKLQTWQHQPDQARTDLLRALELYEQAQSEDGATTTRLQLIHVDLLQQQPIDTVRNKATELAGQFQSLGEPRLATLALALVAETWLLEGRPEAARRVLREARLTLAAAPVVPIELELDWLDVWAATPDQRRSRLLSYAERIETGGSFKRIRQAQAALGQAPADDSMVDKLPAYTRSLAESAM